uniref:EGF-like domain-containing protein n=1 Tax=Macrostomum lignano TaxID=282301 RepID=A0A1I8F2E9_9PLAT
VHPAEHSFAAGIRPSGRHCRYSRLQSQTELASAVCCNAPAAGAVISQLASRWAASAVCSNNRSQAAVPEHCPACNASYADCVGCVADPGCEWHSGMAIVRSARPIPRQLRWPVTACPAMCEQLSNCSVCLASAGCVWFRLQPTAACLKAGLRQLDCSQSNRPGQICLQMPSFCQDCSSRTLCTDCLRGRAPAAGATRWPASSWPLLAWSGCQLQPGGRLQSHRIGSFTCPPVDECALGLATTAIRNATCTDLPSGYKCVCNPGFVGNGSVCTRVCTPACQNGARCSGLPDYAACARSAWTGPDCSQDCGCNGHANCSGGVGICDACAARSRRQSCEFCGPGFYRPDTSSPSASCLPCQCHGYGAPPELCNNSTGHWPLPWQHRRRPVRDLLSGFSGSPADGLPCYSICSLDKRQTVTLLADTNNNSSWLIVSLVFESNTASSNFTALFAAIQCPGCGYGYVCNRASGLCQAAASSTAAEGSAACPNNCSSGSGGGICRSDSLGACECSWNRTGADCFSNAAMDPRSGFAGGISNQLWRADLSSMLWSNLTDRLSSPLPGLYLHRAACHANDTLVKSMPMNCLPSRPQLVGFDMSLIPEPPGNSGLLFKLHTVYSFGGMEHDGEKFSPSDHLYAYDTVQRKFYKLPVSPGQVWPKPMAFHSLVSIGDYLLLHGGNASYSGSDAGSGGGGFVYGRPQLAVQRQVQPVAPRWLTILCWCRERTRSTPLCADRRFRISACLPDGRGRPAATPTAPADRPAITTCTPNGGSVHGRVNGRLGRLRVPASPCEATRGSEPGAWRSAVRRVADRQASPPHPPRACSDISACSGNSSRAPAACDTLLTSCSICTEKSLRNAPDHPVIHCRASSGAVRQLPCRHLSEMLSAAQCLYADASSGGDGHLKCRQRKLDGSESDV